MSPDGPPSPLGLPRAFGLVRLIPTSLVRRAVGLAFALVGWSLVEWAADPATAPASALLFGALGGLVLLDGVLLNGVRPR